MSKADKTIDQRQARYRAAQAKRGMKLVKVWVPEYRVDELKALAEKWRECELPAPNQQGVA